MASERAYACIAVSLAALVAAATLWRDSPSVHVDFLDVGQGDAVLIRSGHTEMLIDGGPDRKVLAELGRTMPFFDRTIEYVVLTHPHADHFTGLGPVFDRYSVGRVIVSGARNESADYAAFEKAVAAAAPVTEARVGDRVIVGRAALEVLWPMSDVADVGDLNDASVVMALSAFGRPAAMLMGDATAEVEEALLMHPEKLRAPVLKVGHHGSKYSSTTAFIKAIGPSDAVIEVGKNSYGHPSPASLLRLRAAGARIWRTDRDGTVRAVFTEDAYRIRAKP